MKKISKRKVASGNKNKLKAFAITSMFTVLLYILLFAVSGFICYKTDIPTDKYYIIMLIISGISALAGGFRNARVNKEKGLINGIIGSVPVILITITAGLLFNNGIPGIYMLLPIVVSLISGAVSGTVAINMRR